MGRGRSGPVAMVYRDPAVARVRHWYAPFVVLFGWSAFSLGLLWQLQSRRQQLRIRRPANSIVQSDTACRFGNAGPDE